VSRIGSDRTDAVTDENTQAAQAGTGDRAVEADETGNGSESADGVAADEAPPPMTVESLVRTQLSKALGGGRGILEGAIPTLGFTITWLSSHDLRLSLIVSASFALVALVIRIAQRSTVQFVMNALVGIGIASIFAMRSGNAEDVFLPGLIYNTAYAVGLIGSVLVRWPLIGLMIGGLTGDLTGWRRDAHMMTLCNRLTLILAAPCVLRVLVQYPIWASEGDHTAALATAKLAMGWPLQLAALALMVWLLSRDKTPVTIRPRV
jgi:Protein of unknown function (DUF3159)